MRNKGYLTANKTIESDEQYTPKYAVVPLLKYIKRDFTIWCPFDTEESEFVKTFIENENKVIFSHIDNGKDFFNYEPDEEYDIIISNPPFSLKTEVLERLFQINKPFAILLPLPSLQRKGIDQLWNKGLQLLSFDKRIDYINSGSSGRTVKGTPFASAYFCYNILAERLIIEKLEKE